MYSGENKLNLTFTPSLEQRTLGNIAISLWNQYDVKDLMSKFSLNILHENWQEIEKAVIDNSFKLQLPQTLNKKLLDFIGRVGLQILSWVNFHHCVFNLVTELPAKFVWTSLGTINNIKSAELLMMSGTLANEKCFTLACIYCIEDKIKYFWNILRLSMHNFVFGVSLGCVPYWTAYMFELLRKEENVTHVHKLFPTLTFFFEATKLGIEAATRYFFYMNSKAKDKIVKNAAKSVAVVLRNLQNVTELQRYSDVMLFLLSIMNVEQQANTMETYTYAFLKCLLVWPWHSLFLELSKDMWNSLSKNEFTNLLFDMINLMCYEHNLHKLFEEFWQQAPAAYKLYLTDESTIVTVIINLYKTGDEKNPKLILKDSGMSTKKNYEIIIRQIVIYWISSQKWDSIEFFLQECLSSRDELIRFRRVFEDMPKLENKFCKGIELLTKKFEWDKFFQLVDGCISRNNKKRCIDGELSSKKHLSKDIEE